MFPCLCFFHLLQARRHSWSIRAIWPYKGCVPSEKFPHKVIFMLILHLKISSCHTHSHDWLLNIMKEVYELSEMLNNLCNATDMLCSLIDNLWTAILDFVLLLFMWIQGMSQSQWTWVFKRNNIFSKPFVMSWHSILWLTL